MSAPTDELLLDFPSVPATREHMEDCIRAIDRQIDEMESRKDRLQLVRRALAELTGKNRDDGSKIKTAMNGADRAQYEGAPS